MRGSVAKKLSSTKALVCLGDNDVEIGDLIKFQRSECSRPIPSSNIGMHEITEVGSTVEHTGYGQSQCELIYLGQGKVVKLVNEHFSIVDIENEFDFGESTQVEKYPAQQ
jgi:hypothetical protein